MSLRSSHAIPQRSLFHFARALSAGILLLSCTRFASAQAQPLPGVARPAPVAPPKPFGALPTPTQLAWHETEMYCLIHFGVDTYTDKEWGYGDEAPALVNPVAFDALQIVGAAKAGGFKGIVVVAKHHDGLCLWPTSTTEHNITKSPWRDGKGDMLKEYQLACNKLGMKLGVYCSPWDRNNAQYGTSVYVQTYRAQLKELYTNYGPLFMSWHDGANGGDGYYGGARETRKIDRTSYYGWDTTWAINQLLDLYYQSVGRGAALDLGIAPDRRGLLNQQDVAALKGFGDLLRQTFSINLAKNASFTASNIRGNDSKKYGPARLVDEDRYSYWATDDSVTEPQLVVDLHQPTTFNVIRLRENIKLGRVSIPLR